MFSNNLFCRIVDTTSLYISLRKNPFSARQCSLALFYPDIALFSVFYRYAGTCVQDSNMSVVLSVSSLLLPYLFITPYIFTYIRVCVKCRGT
ncbi:hypothetical protein C5S39_05325 [Candidatus Methanophagaceae archaeon]|nr:hypothetical protein C5S39_05325 [Methanophagales archaeon]